MLIADVLQKYNLKSLERADLSRTYLSGANLSGADLFGTNLSRANLSGANLSGANLSRANLSIANLSGANLSKADLSEADLFEADLFEADLSEADLYWADLSGANLSGTKGLPDSASYISQFEKCEHGLIVFKGIGHTTFPPPKNWIIAPGEELVEICNPNRTTSCGCGVNFATRDWIKKTYPYATVWKCLIKWNDMADIVVPYNMTGKARCSRLTLIEEVK